MGSVTCPVCGQRVLVDERPSTTRMAIHYSKEGECPGSRRSPITAKEWLRTQSNEQRRYGVEGV